MSVLIVEERLARVDALMLAMRCTAAHGRELPGASDACAWLHLMAQDDLAKIRKSLGPEILNGDAA
jgi:hypothetical protein